MKRTTLLVTVGVSVLALLAVVVGKGGGMIVIANRVRVVVVMVSALAVAAGLLTLAVVLEKPAQAQAETITSTDRDTVSGTIGTEGSCTDEPVFIEGTLHTVGHTTIDATGGFHTKFQFNYKAQGEGLSSGDKYVYHDVFNDHAYEAWFTNTFNETFTETIKLIRQGSATPTDDLNFKVLFHVTVNAQGEVTSDVFKMESECT
jgi:hypothetical protein